MAIALAVMLVRWFTSAAVRSAVAAAGGAVDGPAGHAFRDIAASLR